MNNTLTALIIKLVMTTIFVWLTIGVIDGNSLGLLLVLGIIATVGNYVIGDLGILPKFGNIVASLGDGGMGAIIAYLMSLLLTGFNVSATSLIAFFVLVSVGEFFFHQFLLSNEKVAPN